MQGRKRICNPTYALKRLEVSCLNHLAMVGPAILKISDDTTLKITTVFLKIIICIIGNEMGRQKTDNPN